MHNGKKYLSESLIQLTILLSLIGVRVDIDSYLSGYYDPPLVDIDLGPSSAYAQTPFHSLRDTLDGYSLHPKCPELDDFFASRRLLDQVRHLGSPRFPTQLNAWLVQQVSASGKADDEEDDADAGPSPNTDPDPTPGCQDGGHLPWGTSPGPGTGPGPSDAAACGGLKEFPQQQQEQQEEDEAPLLTQLADSSTLEQENLLENMATPSDPADPHPPAADIDPQWNSLFSDMDVLDSFGPERLSDITSPISQDVSLLDAMMTGAAGIPRSVGGPAPPQQRGLLRLESSGSALGLAALPFASVCDMVPDTCQHSGGGGLDEAVFDHINQLGLGGLDSMDSMDEQLMRTMDRSDSQLLEDVDSDSGLSLESSSGGPISPGSSEISSSSSSYREECGATGYSSEVDSLPAKGVPASYSYSDSVWHNHSYSSSPPPLLLPPPGSCRAIKQEPLSEEEEEEEEEVGGALGRAEPSRDELRARAMCIPFSARQIVDMPVEEFLEALEGGGLTPQQVALLRDIRRRGKNKLAAQNCRRRKMDAIARLQEEVSELHALRHSLRQESKRVAKSADAARQQVEQLSRLLLAGARDEAGRPLDPEAFALEVGPDGEVLARPLRRAAAAARSNTDKRKKKKKK